MVMAVKEENENYIKNSYIGEGEKKVDTDKLKEDLRKKLTDMVAKVSDKFETVSVKKVMPNGDHIIDPSIQNGSGGVLLAMIKYLEFL